MGIKTTFSAALAVLLAALFAVNAFAGERAGVSKSKDGVKAVLKVTETMVDLYLTDEATGKAITEVEVRAHITTPDGRRVDKDLPGMKMGPTYSFMNSLDASARGVYRFNVSVKRKSKEIRFDFDYRVE